MAPIKRRTSIPPVSPLNVLTVQPTTLKEALIPRWQLRCCRPSGEVPRGSDQADTVSQSRSPGICRDFLCLFKKSKHYHENPFFMTYLTIQFLSLRCYLNPIDPSPYEYISSQTRKTASSHPQFLAIQLK